MKDEIEIAVRPRVISSVDKIKELNGPICTERDSLAAMCGKPLLFSVDFKGSVLNL